MRKPSEMGGRVHLRPPDDADADEFLSRVRASRALHRPWVAPPGDEAAFTAYVRRNGGGDYQGFLACRREDGAMVGVVNLSQVFRGSFNGAYLGFYGFLPFARKGYMTEAVGLLLRHAFRSMGLHRVEANMQPGNERSRALVERLGFRLEGFSPRYLKIAGRWRDHERWAILAEEWRPRPERDRGPYRAMGKRVDSGSSEPALDLRPARPDDVPAVLALWRRAELFPSSTDDVDSVRRLIEYDAAALLVADLGGGVIGSVCATWDGWRGNLYRLAVHPDHRRRGIALKLVARAEQWIAGLGGRRISSIVVDEDEHAVAFWRAAGYERDERVSRFVKNR